jgi:type I restriction enzyme S subunit
MRTKNVQAALDDSNLWAIRSEVIKRKEQLLQPGDILVSSANSASLVGKCCWVPELEWAATFGGFIAVLRAKPGRVSPRYLYHWFSSPNTQRAVRSLSRQTTNIANLSYPRCLDLSIPVPPLQEQRRISEVLDRADELRAKRRQALAHLDDLTQSIFLSMFGDLRKNPKKWAFSPFNALITEFRYGTSTKSANTGRPTLRIPNVAAGNLDLSDLKSVPVGPAEFARLRLVDGDLLFVRTNGNPSLVGRCAAFYESLVAGSGLPSSEFIYASYLIRARLSPGGVTPPFIQAFFASVFGRAKLRERCKTSAGQYNLNVEGLGSVPVPVPPLELQHRFADLIAQVDQLKQSHRAQAAELDGLFAALRDRAFAGLLWRTNAFSLRKS